MDVTQALKDTENALRDFISLVLKNIYGDNWIDESGVSKERIEKWNERKLSEEKRQTSGVVEERLIYYADFYDLKTILKKHWNDEFHKVFGAWKTFEVMLSELEKLRNPDAHRRELLPHQKHLVLGISGEIRNRLIRYRNKMDSIEDVFPRIESVRDSLGHIWTPDQNTYILETGSILRPNDVIEFVITASDPKGEQLEYGLDFFRIGSETIWQEDNSFTIKLLESHISKQFSIKLSIRSLRDYHANQVEDDYVIFLYTVLPNK